MLNRLNTSFLFALIAFWAVHFSARAQKTVEINDKVSQHMFTFGEIDWLKDRDNTLSFEQVSSKSFAPRFQKNLSSTPQTKDLSATYWFRIRIKHNSKADSGLFWSFLIKR